MLILLPVLFCATVSRERQPRNARRNRALVSPGSFARSANELGTADVTLFTEPPMYWPAWEGRT